ncbi:hypothetical protein [Arvimicrobium flavum]|uniref:hypothetical protein n=1 Tax=Arvimicrobium flavum TaxID=3393320 RepID=UPI00237AA522|nr:hypothetical protein [Mesorhizobium shangrilense]
MKTMLACAALFAAFATSAVAEMRYDRKLEAAVKAKVAARIGAIRAGFDHGQAAVFLRLPEAEFPASVATAEPESIDSGAGGTLSLATERRATRRIF